MAGLRYAITLTFKVTNNDAEYKALITGLQLAQGVGMALLSVKCVSELMITLIKWEYKDKEREWKKYLMEANWLRHWLKKWKIIFKSRPFWERQMS